MKKNKKVIPRQKKESPKLSPDTQQFLRLGFAFLFLILFSSTGLFPYFASAQSHNFNSVQIGEKDTTATEAGRSQGTEALVPAQKPLVPTTGPVTRGPFGGNRAPAIAPIELDIVRTADGKLQIRSINPQSVFAARVKQSQIFNNWEDVWSAIGERPEIESDTLEESPPSSPVDAHTH